MATITKEAKEELLRLLENCSLESIGIVESFPTSEEKGSGWIPVQEGLPNRYQNVLINCGQSQCYEGHFTGERWEYADGDVPTKKVTHWMDKPLPPK